MHYKIEGKTGWIKCTHKIEMWFRVHSSEYSSIWHNGDYKYKKFIIYTDKDTYTVYVKYFDIK